MSTPAVTVCMPVFNAALYLDEALDSVRTQSYSDFELLVFDDGSSDASRAIVERHARLDPRIRCFERTHRGYAPLLNEGLQIARGKYYARMDGDDVSLPGRFEKQVAFLVTNPVCSAVGTQILMVDPEGDVVNRARHPLTHSEIDPCLLRGVFGMTHGSIVMRTAALRSIGGYHTEFEPAEDYDLLLRLGEVGTLANLPEFLYAYRMHPQQVTVRRYERQQSAMREALSLACVRRGMEVSQVGPFIHPRHERPWQVHIVWAECATRAGFRRAAIKHARRALRLRPWSRTAWRVLSAALRVERNENFESLRSLTATCSAGSHP
jgi:glycosyltransferase involved in cell wall biosynthesis